MEVRYLMYYKVENKKKERLLNSIYLFIFTNFSRKIHFDKNSKPSSTIIKNLSKYEGMTITPVLSIGPCAVI